MNSKSMASQNGRVDQWHDQLPFYVAGTLSSSEIHALEEHLQSCVDCQVGVEAWQKIAETVRANTANRISASYVLPPLPAVNKLTDISHRRPSMIASHFPITRPATKPTSQILPRRLSIGLSAPGVAVLLIALLGITALFPMFSGGHNSFLSGAVNPSATPNTTATPPTSSSTCPPIPAGQQGTIGVITIAGGINATVPSIAAGTISPESRTTITTACLQAGVSNSVQLCSQAATLLDPIFEATETALPPQSIPTNGQTALPARTLAPIPISQVSTMGCLAVAPVLSTSPMFICSATGAVTLLPGDSSGAQATDIPAQATICSTSVMVYGQTCPPSVISVVPLPILNATPAPGQPPQIPATAAALPVTLSASAACIPPVMSIPAINVSGGCVTSSTIILNGVATPVEREATVIAIDCSTAGLGNYIQVCPDTAPLSNPHTFWIVIGPPFPPCDMTAVAVPAIVLTLEPVGTIPAVPTGGSGGTPTATAP